MQRFEEHLHAVGGAVGRKYKKRTKEMSCKTTAMSRSRVNKKVRMSSDEAEGISALLGCVVTPPPGPARGCAVWF